MPKYFVNLKQEQQKLAFFYKDFKYNYFRHFIATES